MSEAGKGSESSPRGDDYYVFLIQWLGDIHVRPNCPTKTQSRGPLAHWEGNISMDPPADQLS